MNEELFKDRITKEDFDNEIYYQIAKSIAKAGDIDLAKVPLVDLITTYVNYRELQKQNEFLTKRENKLQTIEQMFKSGSVDLDKLRKIVLEEK